MGYLQEQKKYNLEKINRSKNEYKCTTCDHTVYIHPSTDKALCEYCHRYIYRNEKNNIEYLSKIEFLKRRYYHFERKNKNEI